MRSTNLPPQGPATKASSFTAAPLAIEIVSIPSLLLASPSQGSIYTHAAAWQFLPLFLFPVYEMLKKQATRHQKPLPCKPYSRVLDQPAHRDVSAIR